MRALLRALIRAIRRMHIILTLFHSRSLSLSQVCIKGDELYLVASNEGTYLSKKKERRIT